MTRPLCCMSALARQNYVADQWVRSPGVFLYSCFQRLLFEEVLTFLLRTPSKWWCVPFPVSFCVGDVEELPASPGVSFFFFSFLFSYLARLRLPSASSVAGEGLSDSLKASVGGSRGVAPRVGHTVKGREGTTHRLSRSEVACSLVRLSACLLLPVEASSLS